MATVRMKKGDKYADVFDSPETIKQAQYEGYSLCEEKKSESKKDAEEKGDEQKEEATERKPRSARQ